MVRIRWIIAWAAGVGLVLNVGAGCRWLFDSESGAKADGRVTAMITAANGGTVRTMDGIVLDIPPGAVSKDVQVTLIPIQRSDFAPGWFAGVHLEPSGLQFARPAMLTFPLSQPAFRTNPPKHLEYSGRDPHQAYENGVVYSLSPDGKTATLSITHFSGAICAENCHAGTMEFLTEAFRKRGLYPADILACVQKKFPGITLPTFCGRVDPFGVQPILDAFFDQADTFAPGQDVPATLLAQLTSAASSGRNVVFAFSRQTPRGRTGERGFYEDITHTAVLEMRQGKWQIRNAVVIGSEGLRLLGGTNLVWSPLEELNVFRNLPGGAAIEIQICGIPGCLGRTSSTDLEATHIYEPLANRSVPWGGLRIYIERPGAIAGCSSGDGGIAIPLDAGVDVNGLDAWVDVGVKDMRISDMSPGDSVDAISDLGRDMPISPPDRSPDLRPDVATCPTYAKTVGYCAGENNCPLGGGACVCGGGTACCIPGFCWTRYIAGCTQETCPLGAKRNYTNHCTCPEKTKAVYDPCRPGLVLSCDPL